jgi:hypothetical protein
MDKRRKGLIKIRRGSGKKRVLKRRIKYRRL